ncbi:MAG: glycosyltransferase [Ilumatobacteraceae bacterium]
MIGFAPPSVVGLDLVPDAPDLALFLVGWLAGWFLLWRPRPLPPAPTATQRRPIAVIVPARDEEAALGHLLPPLVAQLEADDELIVVDDHSGDATAAAATRLGARVVAAPALPDGWLGKPHACWHGAGQSTAPTLLFLDADVRPAPDLLERIGAAIEHHPGEAVSVQPWHATERAYEQASMMCNVTALMGCGAFTPLGERVRARAAFGPVLAVARDDYDRIGGHADPTIRRMHTEDIGIARALESAQLHTGRPDVRFRMYPDGFRQTVQGWTRSIATGAGSTPWWAALGVLVWVWSLAGGWLTTPVVYPLCALQLFVLGRRAGSIHPLTAALYPITVLVFVLIFLRSVVTLVFGRDVAWKGRRVDARSPD